MCDVAATFRANQLRELRVVGSRLSQVMASSRQPYPASRQGRHGDQGLDKRSASINDPILFTPLTLECRPEPSQDATLR
jgi:hypothetical protein